MLEYELVRSSRKTIGISVADGKVVVKAPKNVSKRNIDLFVFKSLDWIEKKLAISEQNKKRFAGYLISYAQNSPRSLFRVCRQDREWGI